jgi:hypothetical protein
METRVMPDLDWKNSRFYDRLLGVIDEEYERCYEDADEQFYTDLADAFCCLFRRLALMKRRGGEHQEIARAKPKLW